MTHVFIVLHIMVLGHIIFDKDNTAFFAKSKINGVR